MKLEGKSELFAMLAPSQPQTLFKRGDTLLAEFGDFLANGDPDTFMGDMRKLLEAANEFMEGLAHPLECARNRDDVDCTCSIHYLQEDIADWLADATPRESASHD